MADFYSSYWGNNYSPRIRLSVSVANLNGNTARVTWILDYVTSGYAAYTNGIARAWSVNIDGQVRSGSYNINGVSSTTRIANGTIDVARGTSARNISCSASLNFDVTWNGSYSGSRSASGSLGVERKVSYTVSFNANGGTGAPGSQTRWYGEVIYLSSVRPTRTGYIFQGWAKSPDGRVEYQPGSAYGLDANTTLYAIWSPETYTISFNANGGSGAPGNQTKTYGQTLTLSSTRPTRTNYNFMGWGSSSGSTTAEYQPGGAYTNNGPATLYAIWELAYTPPRITNLQADRCNSGGILSESGTYVKVSFSWATDYNVSAIYIRHKVSTSSTWTTTTVSASGKAGSVSQVIGSNGINTEYVYNIQIEIRDSNGSSIVGQDVGAMLYTIDFKAGGRGVAIGKPATEDNLFEINFPTMFTGGIRYIYIQSGQNLNDYMTPGFYYNSWNVEVANISNTPVNESFTLEVSKHNGVTQTFTRFGDDKPRTWMRNFYNGTWGSWFEVFFANDFNSKLKASLDIFYPVGSIFISTVSTNPSSYMGGTWERFGNGQTLVGVNEGDGDFNTPNKTGGAKSHILKSSNLPSRAGLQVNWRGGVTSYSEWKSGTLSAGTWIMSNPYDTQSPFEEPISNLQPYITVYMWRRTA